MNRTSRLVILVLVIFGLFLFIFFAPVIPVESTNLHFGGINANQQTWGSVSYAIFKCGEVHAYGSSTINGNTVASSDQYRWVCGQN